MKVYFIGAGPGDPELLTIKAKKIIKKADLVIYAGSLINKDIIKLTKPGARLYDSSRLNLQEVFRVFKNERHSEKIIARLHSGDPSIYGALQEQMDWCAKERVAYFVIPGVSSFQAAAASLKQELTLPNVTQTVILTRISGRTKVPAKEDLQRLAQSKATMVIFLSIDRIEDVIKKIKKSYCLDTPVAVIEKVSLRQERKIIGTVQDIVKKVKMAGINRQALIIIGDVFKKNYQKSKLYDKDFSHMFRRKGNLRGVQACTPRRLKSVRKKVRG